MSEYSLGALGWTPVAHADGASALAANTFQALRSTAVSLDRLIEVTLSGEATVSTINRMAIRRASTNAATPTNQVPGLLFPLSQPSLAQGYVSATTGPTLASTQHLHNFAINTYGGFVRWMAAAGQELWVTSATAPNSELILDSVSGVGPMTTNFHFEEM